MVKLYPLVPSLMTRAPAVLRPSSVVVMLRVPPLIVRVDLLSIPSGLRESSPSLRSVSFYELRQTYASMLVNRGVPLAYVVAQLGHSDTRMVEKHYGHLAPSAMAESIRTLAPELRIFGTENVVPPENRHRRLIVLA
jgi:integrase